MNKKEYQKEINQIEASDEFKKKTITFLLEELEAENKNVEKKEEKKKIIWFTPKKVTAAIVTVAVFGASAVVVNSITSMQKSVEILQKQTNFGTETFEGEELLPNLQATQVYGENFSDYFSPQFSLQVTENAVAPDEAAQESEAEVGEKVIPQNQWPSKKLEYVGIFAKDIVQDLGIQDIALEENTIFPIYKNNFQQTKTGYVPDGLSQQDMENILYEQAAALTMEVQSIEPQSVAMNEGQTAQGLDKVVGTTTNQDTITVYRNGKVEIVYAVPLILSIGTRPDSEKELAMQQEYLDLLMQEYQSLLAGMVSPTGKLTKNYEQDGTINWGYQIYEAGNTTQVEKLIGENFTKLNFAFDNEGKLKQINMQRVGVLTEIDELEIKTQEIAKQELINNEGFTFYTQDVELNESQIAGVELIYWDMPTGQYNMPYYKFYVAQESLDNQAEGLTRYIEYYVSAI